MTTLQYCTLQKRCHSTAYSVAAVVVCLLAAPQCSSNFVYAQSNLAVEQPSDDPTSWMNLSEEQVNEVTLRNLRRIVWAMHAYAEANESKLPPASIPNSSLPPQKRLSGFVALLPYLGVKPDYIQDHDATWLKWKADNSAAIKLHNSIDLTKAWDDEANTQAAKTIVSTFVTPSRAAFRDADGFAVSHFALVRGGAGKGTSGLENGAFPFTEVDLHIPDIADGTIATLAIGQIHEQLGPWIAAGESTSRYAFQPSVNHNQPTFGSQFDQATYFANCDGYCYFLDLKQVEPSLLKWAAGRADGKPSALNEFRYANATEWKKANRRGQR